MSLSLRLSRNVELVSQAVAKATCRYGKLGIIRRGISTSLSSPMHSSYRVHTIFGALITLGVGATAFGLYEFYNTFTMWPPEIRGDLRAGIKAKNQGDLSMSEQFLRRAYETAKTLPLELFSPEPHLKLSGIAIALAGVAESNNRPEAAYEILSTALSQLQIANGLTGRERMRAVSIAAKLGEMAETYQQPEQEEERWLTWAVEELLRTLRVEHKKQNGQFEEINQASQDVQVILSELELPNWVSVTDVGAPIEALGQFYARTGNVEYAVPLYLHAISLLVPPASSARRVSTDEQCRGAHLMNNLAELVIRGAPTPDKRHQAEAWARQALGIIEKTKASVKEGSEELAPCELALTAVLFNLGSLREMAADLLSSQDFYKASLEQSKKVKTRAGIIEAQMALRRVARTIAIQNADKSSVVLDSVPSEGNPL